MGNQQFTVVDDIAVLSNGEKVTVSCNTCVWYKGNNRCTAYLDRIPPQILSGQNLHISSFWNDRGIQYQPLILKKDKLDTKALGAALRGGLRTAREGFDPNAIDGDNDGLVQDGTAFERPNLPNVNLPSGPKTNRSARRERNVINNKPSPRQKPEPNEDILDRKPLTQQHAEMREWLKENPGFYQEVSPVEQSVLAEQLKKQGKTGFSERQRGLASGGSTAAKAILDKVRGDQRNKPKKRMFFIGGTTGAGKSTILKKQNLSIPDDTAAAHIDPDEVKKYLSGYNGGKGAGAVHNESRDVTDKIMQSASDAGMDMVVSGTGKRTEHLQWARRRGYETVGHFVYVPDAVADKRLKQRNAHNQANGGPVLPEFFASSIAADLRMTVPRQITSDLYDEFYLWDNRGDAPKLIAVRKKDGSFAIHDNAAFDDFMSPAGAKYVRQHWAANGRERSGLSSKSGRNREPYDLSLSLEDVIDMNHLDDRGNMEEGKPPHATVFGKNIPVPVQHVTSRESAQSIMENGYQLSRAGSANGSMYGHGIYMNVEGASSGFTWANTVPDPVAMSATFTPQNPFVIADKTLDELVVMPLSEFIAKYVGITPKEMLDRIEKLTTDKNTGYISRLNKWIKENPKMVKWLSDAGFNLKAYESTAAGFNRLLRDFDKLFNDDYMFSSVAIYALKGLMRNKDNSTVNIQPLKDVLPPSHGRLEPSNDYLRLIKTLEDLIIDGKDRSVDPNILTSLIQFYIREHHDSLVSKDPTAFTYEGYQIVAYDPNIVKFHGMREVETPSQPTEPLPQPTL